MQAFTLHKYPGCELPSLRVFGTPKNSVESYSKLIFWTKVSDWAPSKNQGLDCTLPFRKPERVSETQFNVAP